MFKRTIYKLKNNRLDTILEELTFDWLPYSMYIQNNDYVYVNGTREKLTKYLILLDIEHIYKQKFNPNSNNLLKKIEGFTPEFLKSLVTYNITYNDIKEVIERAKNYSASKNIDTRLSQSGGEVHQGYVVGKQSGLHY